MGYCDFDWDYYYSNGYPEKDDTVIENEQAKKLMYGYVDEERVKIMRKLDYKPAGYRWDELYTILGKKRTSYRGAGFYLRMER